MWESAASLCWLFAAFHSSSAGVLPCPSPPLFSHDSVPWPPLPTPLLCRHTVSRHSSAVFLLSLLLLPPALHGRLCCWSALLVCWFAFSVLAERGLLSLLSSWHGAETSKKRPFRRVFQSGLCSSTRKQHRKGPLRK